MKKKNLTKLAFSKNTVSKLGTELTHVKGGISGGACEPVGPAPKSIGCPPRSVPYTACQATYDLTCICSR